MNTPMNADEIVGALRICNRPKGHRCSECPIFSRYEHRTCKATVDKAAADLIESQAAKIAELNDFQNSQCAKLLEKLNEAERRERAHEAAIKRHYADMTSQCFICYSCVNHDARQKAKWDGKKLEDYACSGFGDGKPNWKFDVERFMGQEGRK